jgi:cytochrome P450
MQDLMAKCPVNKVRLPDETIGYLVTGFDEAREVMLDQRYSRSLIFEDGRELRGIEALAARGILYMDPPEHTRLRNLVASAFTERRIQALRPQVVQLVNDLIDGMLAGPRPADLSSSFSLILPASVISMLLGVPVADIDKFYGWCSTMSGDWSRSLEDLEAAYHAISAYLAELIEQKRTAPEDDLISLLVEARDAQGKLSEGELVQFCIELLAAGHQATANSINMSFVALWEHPDELARLRADLDLIPVAVEELLRYVIFTGSGAVPFALVTREEVCLGGVTIPAGERVLPTFNFANRDPAAFEDPNRFDVGRQPKNHLAFGVGPHYCLGAQLARMELQVAFRGLLTRLPGLRMAVPTSELEFREGQVIASMRELPVIWDDV